MDGSEQGGLVALKTKRQEAVDVLCEGYALDTISETDFESRLEVANRATSVAELDELVADLVPAQETAAALVQLPEARAMGVTRSDTKNVAAIFGSVNRKGEWRVPKKLRAVAVFGGIELDFREVAIPPGTTELQIYTMFGGTDIIVPPEVAVECNGIAILGGFETIGRSSQKPTPQRSVLRITGIAALGGVTVTTRLVGESNRQAKRRRKREEKARVLARERARKALTSG